MRHNHGMLRVPLPTFRRLLLTLLLGALAWPAWSQSPPPPPVAVEPAAQAVYVPDTGDAWMDARLVDMGRYAERYPDSFLDEVHRYLDVPRAYAAALRDQQGWPPGDIYYACALGKALGQPCRAVVQAWSRDHSEGWRGVARSLDAKLGRTQSAALRTSVRDSYARWARPLP